MSEINLRPFCSTEFYRPALMQPFSIGDHSFATNGHIAIRVVRRADVPDRSDAPDMGRLFKDTIGVSWRPLRKFDVPKEIEERCRTCDGRGHKHDCPDCECECENCGGTGIAVEGFSICIGEGIFNVKYVLLLASLSGIMVPEIVNDVSNPMPFKFDGGDGMLMARRIKCESHIETPA